MIFDQPNGICQYRAETLLTKEPGTIAWIRDIPVGSVIYDIGANVGMYSIFAASLGHKVIAIEPVPESYAVLCRNIQLNGFQGLITPICAAVGDRNGFLAIGDNPAGAGTISFSADGLRIPKFTLNSLIEQLGLPKPTHLKIDTDGDEVRVLAGASLNTVKSIMVETDSRETQTQRAIEGMLDGWFENCGRHVSPLTPKSPIGMDEWNTI